MTIKTTRIWDTAERRGFYAEDILAHYDTNHSYKLTPATAGLNTRANAGDRWSMVGMSQALRTLSGIFVGPGMKTGF